MDLDGVIDGKYRWHKIYMAIIGIYCKILIIEDNSWRTAMYLQKPMMIVDGIHPILNDIACWLVWIAFYWRKPMLVYAPKINLSGFGWLLLFQRLLGTQDLKMELIYLIISMMNMFIRLIGWYSGLKLIMVYTSNLSAYGYGWYFAPGGNDPDFHLFCKETNQ